MTAPGQPVDDPTAGDPATIPPADPPEPEAESQDESALPQWAREKIAKTNREAKSLRERLKEAEPLVAAAREAEEANKSELQRATERAQQLESDLVSERVRSQRFALAANYGISEDYQRYIVGDTPEEREEAAVGIAHLLESARGNQQAPPPPTDRPIGSLRPGASPPPPAPEDNSYPESWRPARRDHA